MKINGALVFALSLGKVRVQRMIDIIPRQTGGRGVETTKLCLVPSAWTRVRPADTHTLENIARCRSFSGSRPLKTEKKGATYIQVRDFSGFVAGEIFSKVVLGSRATRS